MVIVTGGDINILKVYANMWYPNFNKKGVIFRRNSLVFRRTT